MAKLTVPVRAGDHSQGPADAGCALVEYGDYQCPSCGQAHSIVKRLQRHFGDRLRFVYRHFPLSQIHPQAEAAAETAEFADKQGEFWRMHDLLYENQKRLGPRVYEDLAAELKFSAADLKDALEKGAYRARVHADYSGGVSSGVHGTPTFFINGERNDGSYDFESLSQLIEEQLGSSE